MDTEQTSERESTREVEIKVSVEIIETGQKPYEVKFEREAQLVDVLERGLSESGNQLVPPPQPPLDTLHNLHHKEVGPAIEDLEQPLWAYLRKPHTTRDFGIALVLAIRVNTRWAIAPESQISPRQILSLFDLDYQQYTLYRPGSSQPLPLDTPIQLKRGDLSAAD